MNLRFETIYQDFDDKIKKFIAARVSNTAQAEDILQDVYIKIHTKLDTLQDTHRLSPWIYQITRNAIIDHYRRARPESALPEGLVAPEIEEPDLLAQLSASVKDMINCLADIQRLSQAEVAQRLGLSRSGANSRIQRARQKLKQAFLKCCYFKFDHLGRAMEYQSNCNHRRAKNDQTACSPSVSPCTP